MKSIKDMARWAGDQDTSAHEWLNEATELLQYARGLTELLGELVHEPGVIDSRRLSLGLGAIGVLTDIGVQCAQEAHERMMWERSGAAKVPLIDTTRIKGVKRRGAWRRSRPRKE